MYVKYLALLGEACWMRISSPLLATDWSNFFCSASCSSSSWKANMPNSWTQLFMISFSLQKSSPDFIKVCYCGLFLLQWKYHYQMHMCCNISKEKKKVLKRGNRKRENIPFVSVGCLGVAGIAWSGPGPASPAHWDSERGLSLIHCPPAPAESPKKADNVSENIQ